MDKRYAILTPVDGPLMCGIAVQPFLTRGQLLVADSKAHPTWLPPVTGAVYCDTRTSNAYSATADAGGAVRVERDGPIAYDVFGAATWNAVRRNHRTRIVFGNSAITKLAKCLEDDTEINLPARKAERMLSKAEPITLTKGVLLYALASAIEEIGRCNARLVDPDPAKQNRTDHVPLTVRPELAWTLRRLFGSVHLA